MTTAKLVVKSIINLDRFGEVVGCVNIEIIRTGANKLGIILPHSATGIELAGQLERVAYKKGMSYGQSPHINTGHYYEWLELIAEELIATIIGSSQWEVGNEICEWMEAMKYDENGEKISYEPYIYNRPWYSLGTLNTLLHEGKDPIDTAINDVGDCEDGFRAALERVALSLENATEQLQYAEDAYRRLLSRYKSDARWSLWSSIIFRYYCLKIVNYSFVSKNILSGECYIGKEQQARAAESALSK